MKARESLILQLKIDISIVLKCEVEKVSQNRKVDMNRLLIILISVLFFFPLESKELEKCKWKNESGTPCLTIFSAPNTSDVNEGALGKTVITKKQIIESGNQDVRSLLE